MEIADYSMISEAECFTLTASDIEPNWDWIESFLLMVDRFDWTLEDVRADLESGEAQLWGIKEGDEVLGIWITKIQKSRSLTWGLLWICAGAPLDVGVEFYRRYTEPWFIEKGCDFIEIAGRPGWGKVFTDYNETARMFVKELR
jgi:hypothetical protein